ncbi:tyrosine-type recombinase/integrase [Rhodocyclus tenuis]|uniref:site-specific integrase n=1 Tax=Rhodocyclus gracilis TaxID=2929842 RepID=UPI001298A86F|nr:site-specific integrase [Rhodocyclus gracilis]MRD74131.1 tyrosine-type recombinase/integrase [Rhodocyclus gracilis]
MATFRQRASGYWQAIVRRRGWPPQSQTFRTKVDAAEWARGVESEMDRGTFQSTDEAERTLFKDIVKRFKTEFAPNHYRQRDDNKESWRFQSARLEEFFGAYSLAAIDQKLVARYRDERINPPLASKRKAVANATVRKELYLLSKILGYAESECGIRLPRGNPVEKVRKPADSESRDRRLTAEEWKKLEAECIKSRNKHLHPALILAVETAMRQDELLSLQAEHIDEERKIAFLPLTKNGEARAVPLTDAALAVLAKLPNTSGRVLPLDRMTLYHAFRAAVTRAGITNYDWHDLRHEALSRLAERGDLSVLELAEISGHKTLQMLKRYTHLQAEKLAHKLNHPTLTRKPAVDDTQAKLLAIISESGLTPEKLASLLEQSNSKQN